MLSTGLLVMRVGIGLIVAAHGAQKLFGWFGGPGIAGFSTWLASMGVRPQRPWAILTGVAEFGGGLLVAVGLLSPLGALAICGSMLTAILMVHLGKGFWNTNGGYEFPLVILAAMFGVSLTGPGPISLDQTLRIALPEPATWLVMAVLVLIGVAGAVLSSRLQSAAQSRPQVR